MDHCAPAALLLVALEVKDVGLLLVDAQRDDGARAMRDRLVVAVHAHHVVAGKAHGIVLQIGLDGHNRVVVETAEAALDLEHGNVEDAVLAAVVEDVRVQRHNGPDVHRAAQRGKDVHELAARVHVDGDFLAEFREVGHDLAQLVDLDAHAHFMCPAFFEEVAELEPASAFMGKARAQPGRVYFRVLKWLPVPGPASRAFPSSAPSTRHSLPRQKPGLCTPSRHARLAEENL
nr:MAG: hypothetical protein [Molluscum contagiosum virus]